MIKIVFFLLLSSLIAADLSMPPQRSYVNLTKFNISWYITPDNSSIVFNINMNQYHYFALAYKPNMTNSDMSIVEIVNNTILVRDYWSTKEGRPALNTNSNIAQIDSATDSKTYINVKFSRPLNSNRDQDNILVLGQENQFSLAWNPNYTALKGHGKNNLLYFSGQMLNSTIGVEQTPVSQLVLIHGILLTICWCILSDIAIFLISYRYKPIYFYFHSALFMICIGISIYIVTALLIAKDGINEYGDSSELQKTHFVIGLACLVWTSIQIISGIFSKILQVFTNAHPKLILIITTIHKILGYILVLLAKINVIIGWNMVDNRIFILVLIYNILIIMIFIWKKLSEKKLDGLALVKQSAKQTQSTVSPQIIQKIKKYTYNNINFNQQMIHFVIFRDEVWDISNLLDGKHPAGSKIIADIQGRQIDRFLYGMYAPEGLKYFAPYLHSAKSLELMGQPICKLPFKNFYRNFDTIIRCTVDKEEYSKNFFMLNLIPKNSTIQFKSPEDLSFIGKYYTVFGNGVTRLYTSMISMRYQNRSFIQTQLSLLGYKFSKIVNKKNKQFNNLETERTINNTSSQSIPLMMKKYDTGKFTSYLFNTRHQVDEIQISPPMGTGIGLDKLNPGRVIVITGGTGIFPFLDLIDLEIKLVFLNQKSMNIKNQINSPPIGAINKLNEFQFQLYAAFNKIDDIPFVTLNSLQQINRKNPRNFKTMIKLREQLLDHQKNQFQSIQFTKQRFDKKFFLEVLLNLDQISMIYICGPAEMTYTINKFFQELNIPKNKIYMV